MTKREDNKNVCVEIPKALIERLQGLGPHFCLVKARDKDPSIAGKDWQKPEKLMFADDPRLQNHLKRGGNYGAVGGFGLVIVDTDLEELKQIVKEKLPPTFTVESPGSHGWHSYFLCGLEKPIRLRDKEGENVGDIQGPGKMVVGPSSIHPNGEVYKVINDLPLAQVTRQQLVEAFKEFVVPDKEIELVEATAQLEKRETKIDLNILKVVSLSGLHKRGQEYFGPHPVHGSKTGRNFWVNPPKNCAYCFRHGTGGGPLIWLAIQEGIIDCSEAGPRALKGEVFKQVLKIAKQRGLIKDVKPAPREGKSKSQADKLIEYCLACEPELFHDQTKTPYTRIKQSTANMCFRTRSKSFRNWLASLLWEAEGKAPSTEAVSGALRVLEARALFKGKEYHLYNRVAPAVDGIWIDMTDDKWRAIKVDAEGWRIVDDPPILFKRYSHQRPLPEPKPSGDPWAFLDFVNVDTKDKHTRLTLLVTVVSFFIPLIPHVIIITYGIQGSGKTCLFKLIRRVVDPSAVEVLTLPRDERERVQQLDHHWCAFYDNVTYLPPWMSDTLCRAATGGGFTKRGLYTDDEDIIYNFKRCVGLNGINIAAQRGDLLDRSLLVGLQDIPKSRRRTERQLLAEFESCNAEILGGFLDVLVKAIRIYSTVNPKELFRMADFTRWGCAIAKALGSSEEDFINAYGAKVKAQIEEAAHASALATVLMDYMEELQKWEGTASELYKILNEHAKNNVGISIRQKAWPNAPNTLTRELNKLAPSLKALGWEVVTGRKSGSKRLILINTVPTVPTDDRDGRDDILPSSSMQLEEIKAVYWSDDFFKKHKCCICNLEKKTCWIAEDFKGNKHWICEDCKDEWEKQRRVPTGEEPRAEIPKTQSENEVKNFLHATWHRGTTEAFYKFIHEKTGWLRDRIAEFVAGLIDQDKMTYDSEGLLIWVDDFEEKTKE